MRCPNCSAAVSDSNVICPECGCETISGLPMRWHLFLVHLGLFVFGVGLILMGILILVGIQYLVQGLIPGTVYGRFVALNIIDVVYGVVLILLGVLCFFIRGWLAAFRKKGVAALYCVYAAAIVCSVLYSVLSSWAVGTPAGRLFGLTELAPLVGMAAGVALNALYYKKRGFLFR